MAPPPRMNLIDDDVLAEILLRLPPGEPEHLFRAALVCKPWLRVVCLPAFRTQYRAFHGAPPLLGLLYRNQVCDGDPAPRFASTTSVPGFPHPGSHGRPLDCRHGRVLLHMFYDSAVDLLVWDPVTGDRRVVPEPDVDWLVYTAAVFCAAAGCDHLDCHGGAFRVLFLATDDRQEVVKASVYSSATGAWSPPVSLDDSCECYARHKRDATAETMYFSSYIPYVQPRRVAAIGDSVYFTISRSAAIAKYDWGENRLSVIDPPPPNTDVYGGFVSLMVMEDNSLGLAGVDDSTSSLHLWSRTVKGAAKWVQCRVIDLERVMPMANPREGDGAYVVGFAEGVGVIFVRTDAGLFVLELKSGLVKKVDEFGVYFSVLPYMSFYTPDRGRLSSLARLTDV